MSLRIPYHSLLLITHILQFHLLFVRFTEKYFIESYLALKMHANKHSPEHSLKDIAYLLSLTDNKPNRHL